MILIGVGEGVGGVGVRLYLYNIIFKIKKLGGEGEINVDV